MFSELGRLRRLRDARREATGRDMLLAVAGCVAQAEGELLVERAPFVDIVVGPQAYHRLPELLARRASGGGCGDRHRVSGREQVRPAARRTGDGRRCRAFLTIQEGCDKFCTFCVVPYTRGAEQSRPAADILREARAPGRRRGARAHAARPERQRLPRRRPGRRAPGAWPG